MINFNDTPAHVQDELNNLCRDEDHNPSPEGFFNRIQGTLRTSTPQRTSAIYNIREELCTEILTLTQASLTQLKATV